MSSLNVNDRSDSELDRDLQTGTNSKTSSLLILRIGKNIHNIKNPPVGARDMGIPCRILQQLKRASRNKSSRQYTRTLYIYKTQERESQN